MKQIIVATDLSYSSLNAANYAADMAASINMDIILVHVMETPTTAFQVPFTELEFTVLEKNIHEELDELRQKLLLRTRNKINVSKELRYGVIGQELEKLCEETKPFAIVMGIANGKKGIRFFLGSDTLRL
ncbi:MAG TPA: universal stress protein, partial [Puia sp.]